MRDIIRLLLQLATINKTYSTSLLSDSVECSLKTLILSEQQSKELGRESERQGALLSPLVERLSRAAHLARASWALASFYMLRQAEACQRPRCTCQCAARDNLALSHTLAAFWLAVIYHMYAVTGYPCALDVITWPDAVTRLILRVAKRFHVA